MTTDIPSRVIRNIADRISDYAEWHHIPEKDIPPTAIDRLVFEWARAERLPTSPETRLLARRYARQIAADPSFRKSALTC